MDIHAASAPSDFFGSRVEVTIAPERHPNMLVAGFGELVHPAQRLREASCDRY